MIHGLFLVLFALLLTGNSQAETVCAQVKIEIKQELTLERQAFDAMMRINNGLDTLPINNVNVSVNFEDEAGNSVSASTDSSDTQASFFIRIDTMENISDVNGYGSVAPSTTAEIHWLIIPAPGAAENSPTGKLYFVGATLNYTLGGEPESVTVTPDFITVKPLPSLTLDYFLTREVRADDPMTTDVVEPTEPFTLGVRVRNNGLAEARNLKIESAQPRIVENEQGLLIGFEIIGSTVDDQPAAPTLLTDFGTIPGNSSKAGRWLMTSSQSGEFVDFSATFTHADELGGALTSILEATNAHLLVRDVRVDLTGRDSVRDFLAEDGDILRVYESDSIDTAVTDRSELATFQLQNQSGTLMTYELSFPATNGFSYVKLVDPYSGQKEISRVVRSDGKLIPSDNAWTSRSRNRNAPSGWDYYINFFDANTTGVYSVQMDDRVTGPVPPVLQYIPTRTTYEGNQIGFVVEASDPNGEIPALSAAPLPTGAVFADNGDGQAFFNWTPSEGQAGVYTITYTATDGALSSSRSAVIRVNSASDTDGDGMDDAWELEHFGNLDRDGTGDFDGDGISDLDEYLNGTDPSNGPQVPVIDLPLYGAEVGVLQPGLTVVNIAHAGDVTMSYDYELYADAEMTQLVTQVMNHPEGTDTTTWVVPEALSDNTAYTWRVRAYDGSVYSLWSHGRFFVNTQNDPPNGFTISSPTDGSEVDRVDPLLAVSNALDVDGDVLTYRFEISELADFSTIVTSAEGIRPGIGGSTGWVVDTDLTENTYYYWRTYAVDEHGLETAGPTAGLFVNTANDAPLTPMAGSPATDAVVADTDVTLAVQNSADPDGDSLSYFFELDRVNTFDSADRQVSAAIDEQPNTTQWTANGLLDNATYYWRAKASDGVVDSDWLVSSFRIVTVNLPPPAPTIRNPGDSAWVAAMQPTLEINDSVDPNGDSVSYHFELYSDVELTGLVSELQTAETVWEVPVSLANYEWYYWRVRAEDAAGEMSEWSTVSRFFVDDNGVNDTPTLSFIEPAQSIEVTTGVTTLRWTDDDPDSSATIRLYYDNNNSGEDGTLFAEGIDEDSDEAGDLYEWHVATQPEGVYWVYAVIDDGNSSSTVYCPFAIDIKPTDILDDPDINDEGGFCLTDFEAQAGVDEVQLIWAHSGAPLYNLYRSDDGGVSYHAIAQIVSTDPSYLDSGLVSGSSYQYALKEVDGDGFEVCQSPILYITPKVRVGNKTPGFTSVPVADAQVGQLYQYDVDATDLQGDPIRYSLSVYPAGMVIDSQTGVITWTPEPNQTGDFVVRVRAVDDSGLFDQQGYWLTVTNPPPSN